jgi:hypothetical protein
MLPAELRADVLEIADIAKACPPNLQERCFDVLLTNYLNELKVKHGEKLPSAPPKDLEGSGAGKPADISDQSGADLNPNSKNQDQDIEMKDLHVKAKRFLEKYGSGLEDINQLFYKQNGNFLPLYEELKSTKIAECQTRVGLLQALASGLKTGEFQFSGEDVRKECQDRKCYDGNNFSANFKNSSSLFEGFEKYDKSEPTVKLSEAGRKQLASLIDELK